MCCKLSAANGASDGHKLIEVSAQILLADVGSSVNGLLMQLGQECCMLVRSTQIALKAHAHVSHILTQSLSHVSHLFRICFAILHNPYTL